MVVGLIYCEVQEADYATGNCDLADKQLGRCFPAPVVVDGEKKPEIKICRCVLQVADAEIQRVVGFHNAWLLSQQGAAQCTGFSASPSFMPTASSRLSRVHNIAPDARRVAASKWASM